MTRLIFLTFFIALLSLQGCQEKAKVLPRPNLEKWQAAFKQANKIEILSILPGHSDSLDSLKFHKWPIVGSATITDPMEKERLYQLLDKIIFDEPEPSNEPHTVTGCKFSPHHGLSITDKTEIHDLLICFTCDQVQRISRTLPTGRFESGGLTTKEFEELEAIFKAHGIETLKEHAARRRKEAETKESTKQ